MRIRTNNSKPFFTRQVLVQLSAAALCRRAFLAKESRQVTAFQWGSDHYGRVVIPSNEIPDSQLQNDDFKAHIRYLQELSLFRNAKLVINSCDISEIDSHKHPIQQCMDIVLGAMAFHLNNFHLVIPKGATAPGQKTLAKERLFQHILSLIKAANKNPNFNIYENTQPETGRGRWVIPYRHWKFVPEEFRV